MIKLLVVEDETILREGICSVGEWERNNIDICATAGNGMEAIDKIKKTQPDIILTDVVMPIMNGIELTKYVFENYPNIKVILLSGHEEFEYAKKAMDYKACNYLLKPVKIERLMEVVCGIRDEIYEVETKEKERVRLQRKLEESIPIVREHLLNQMLNDVDYENGHIDNLFDFLGIDLKLDRLALVLCELDSNIDDKYESSLALIQLKEICQEVFNEYNALVFDDLKDRIVIILNCPTQIDRKDFLVYLEGKSLRIQKELEAKSGRSASLGIGRMIQNGKYLSKAYHEAEWALNYRFFMNSSSVIYIGDIEKEQNEDWLVIQHKEELILECMKVGDVKGVAYALNEYFKILEKCSGKGQSYILQKIEMLLSYLIHFVNAEKDENEMNSSLSKKLEELFEKISKSGNYSSFNEIKENVMKIIVSITETINENHNLRNAGIIDKAKKYIMKNLDGDVSLITVADIVFVSPNYLSFLFKENGENFKEYVVKAKMEEASRLINDGKLNLNQIAERVGYKDGRYLSRVYKRYFEIN